MANDYSALMAWNPGSAPAQPAPTPAPSSGPYAALMAWDPNGAKPANEVGTLEAVGRGALQGATLGFADEATGVIGGLSNALQGKSFVQGYRAERDEARANNQAAIDQHPLAYGAGDLAGGVATSFVPGLSLAKGASLAANVAKGAAVGAAQGFGSSDADLTKGDVGGAVRDTAIGGAIGGVAGAASKGLEKLAEGAPQRQVDRFMSEVGDGATIKQRDKLAQAGGRIESFLENNPKEAEALQKVAKKPDVLSEKLTGALEDRAGKLDTIYKAADKPTGGIKVGKVNEVLDELKSKLVSDPHESQERLAALEKIKRNVELSWGDDLEAKVNSQALRKLVSDLQATAYSKSILAAERPGQETAREAATVLKQTLENHVRSFAPQHIEDLSQLNSEVSALAQMKAAADYRAMREPSWPRNRLAIIKDKAVEHGALIASIASHNPLPIIAEKAALPALKLGTQAADKAYARLVKAALNGSTKADILRMAAEQGVPRQLALKAAEVASRTNGGNQ